MGNFLIKRAVHSAISMVALVMLVFFLARLTGNPADLYLPVDAPPTVRAEFSKAHGLDDPASVQFVRYVQGLAHLDLGESMRQGRPALDIVFEALPVTVALSALAMAVTMLIAVVSGALAARHPNGPLDRFVSLIALAGASIPTPWLAIVTILIFAVRLQWLPTSGMGSISHWILPIAALAIRPCGIIAQVVRSEMIDAFAKPYIKTAIAKGVRPRSIVFVHALRNAMLPVLTVAGDQAAGMINGAVIVEVIFGFPGIGKLTIDSIATREFVVLQATVIVVAIIIFAMNLLIDMAYALLDPRIRTH